MQKKAGRKQTANQQAGRKQTPNPADQEGKHGEEKKNSGGRGGEGPGHLGPETRESQRQQGRRRRKKKRERESGGRGEQGAPMPWTPGAGKPTKQEGAGAQ